MPTDFKDLLATALQDTYSAETQILDALPKVIEAVTSPALKQGLEQHLRTTERQAERLETVCSQLGIEPEGESCEAMEGLVEEIEELMDEMDAGPVLDAALIGAAQKVEHYEIAAYGTLCALLGTLGETRCAALMAETLREEKDADDLLTRVAEGEVNPAALGAGGMPANDDDRSRRGAA